MSKHDEKLASKKQSLLQNDFAEECRECGAVVFEWFEACRECGDGANADAEQQTLVTDGGVDRSESGLDRAEAEVGALTMSVRIDGDWCPEVRWYTPDLPVFIAEDGTEVDIRDDGSILYESADGAVEELDPVVEKEAKQIYEPASHYPADTIEVQDVNRRPVRSEPADFGRGDSTGVQSL